MIQKRNDNSSVRNDSHRGNYDRKQHHDINVGVVVCNVFSAWRFIERKVYVTHKVRNIIFSHSVRVIAGTFVTYELPDSDCEVIDCKTGKLLIFRQLFGGKRVFMSMSIFQK